MLRTSFVKKSVLSCFIEDVPKDGYWYDSTNMDDEEIAPNLYD